MTDEEIKRYIDAAIKATVAEYRREGLLRRSESAAYDEAAAILEDYFAGGKKDAEITYAINGLRFDPYFRIIGMKYEEGRTLEDIAEAFGVGVSTIVRNKKRLCLAIYDELN